MSMPGGFEMVIIVLVILLLFGAKRIPELARGIVRVSTNSERRPMISKKRSTKVRKMSLNPPSTKKKKQKKRKKNSISQ